MEHSVFGGQFMGQLDTFDERARQAECISSWYGKHCVPVVQAIYVKDENAAVSRLANARYILETSDLSKDIKNALRYRLRYIQWQMERICQTYSQVAIHAQQACNALGLPAGGPVAEIVRNMVLVQMRTTCLRDNILPYPAEEFEVHFKAVDAAFRSLEFWHYVSTWAFLSRRQDYLGQALEVHTIHADGFMSDFLWQRINLMLQLLKGAAASVDVIELIKRIDNELQWQNVEKVIWPACQQAGLVDAKVEQRLAAQLVKIGGQPPRPPLRERATKALIYR